jgi:hypothetical protein
VQQVSNSNASEAAPDYALDPAKGFYEDANGHSWESGVELVKQLCQPIAR